MSQPTKIEDLNQIFKLVQKSVFLMYLEQMQKIAVVSQKGFESGGVIGGTVHKNEVIISEKILKNGCKR